MTEFLIGFIVGSLIVGCVRDWRRAAVEAECDYLRWLAANRLVRLEMVERPNVNFSRN